MSAELGSYAVTEKLARGRIFEEEPHPYRSDFERDRDRIIHCTAFRRLEGKTQVFTPGLDDYYRTRLTHSIEVAQIGRTAANALGLNVNLTEAICLGHDLGHSPFGHAGERTLNRLMDQFGGFEHNRQTMRIIDLLEHPYPDFAGLNLMYETRLGLSKHKSTYDKPAADDFTESNCSLEGQVADVADRIAYNCHDLEDGLRAGLLGEQQLVSIDIFAAAQRQIRAEQIEDGMIRSTRTTKAIIDRLVSDCIKTSRNTLNSLRLESVDDVYRHSEHLVSLSTRADSELAELEQFLLSNLYNHKSMAESIKNVKVWLEKLFVALCDKPDLMPGYFRQLAAKEGWERTVCDYIAGMTDRFCIKMLEDVR
jgi:dGTPase